MVKEFHFYILTGGLSGGDCILGLGRCELNLGVYFGTQLLRFPNFFFSVPEIVRGRNTLWRWPSGLLPSVIETEVVRDEMMGNRACQ